MGTSPTPFASRARRIPGALLFYNDYGGEGMNAKSDRIYALLRDLLAKGVPIDGVGLQMHILVEQPSARCEHRGEHAAPGEPSALSCTSAGCGRADQQRGGSARGASGGFSGRRIVM